MTLVLVSRANGLWGGRFSQIFFDEKIFNPYDKSCPKTKSDAYNYERAKYSNTNKKSRIEQQLCTTSFCVYWMSSTRLYKNRLENSGGIKQKTERIILRHNKFYQNQNKFFISEECNSSPQGVKKLKKHT